MTTITPMDARPTLAEMDGAVARADAVLAKASEEERGAAEVEALAMRLKLARRVLLANVPNTSEGVRLAMCVSEWLRVHGTHIGPARVQSLTDFLRASQAAGGKAVHRAA